eukprot:SAG31_NODE_13028_length_898_cov_1.216521_1_plen_104_part_01
MAPRGTAAAAVLWLGVALQLCAAAAAAALAVSFDPPVAVMHSAENCPSSPPGKFDGRQTHAWFPTTHGRTGHNDDIFVQIHQDVPGSGCPAAPCNCSVVFRTSD